MKIKECMSKDVCCCNAESTIEEIAKQMNCNHIGCMPVCDYNNKIVGVITDRDIVLRAVACGKDLKTTKASDIMTCNPCSCNENEEVDNATELMSCYQIRRIPVCNENNNVVGIITLGNIAQNDRNIGTQHVCNTLENICKCSTNSKNAE